MMSSDFQVADTAGVPAEYAAAPVEIPSYDPRIGPQITPDMWNPDMLTCDMSKDMLRNQTDPAAFIQARLDYCSGPTNATVFNRRDGSSTPLNPDQMARPDQAEAMVGRLQSLGMRGGEVQQRDMVGDFAVNYADDNRRLLYIGGMNVGSLVQR